MKNEKDFRDFIQTKTSPSTELDQRVLSFVSEDLNPSHQKVFFKLTAVQGFIGFLTMLFCPQFNFSLTNNYDLFHYFHMNYGHQVCMVLCGSIFLGSGAIFANIILSQGEINTIRKSRFLYYSALSIVAVSTFMLFGAEVYINMVTFWLIGAIGGGMLLFELNRLLAKSFRQFQA